MWYKGEDAADEFIRVLQREAEELCADYIETPQEMVMKFTSNVRRCVMYVSKFLQMRVTV